MSRMKSGRCLLAAATVAVSGFAASAQPVDTRFTYQGYLEDRGEPVTGLVELIVEAYDAPIGGAFLGSDSVRQVPVQEGVFSTPVDLGNVFRGDRVWLRIGVIRSVGGSPQFLSPRQEVTAAPYACYSKRAGSAGVADFAASADVSLDDAYEVGRTIDASLGEVAIEKSNGGLFDPATLRIGSDAGGAAGGRMIVTSSNGGTALGLEASGSTNSGSIQLFNAIGTPVVNIQRDTNGGGFLNVYRRDDSGTGTSIGFEVNGQFSNTESTQVTIRGADNTMIFATQNTGDSTVQVPNDAISANEILNEPGVANVASSGSVALTADAATQDTITSRTITCPTDGFVIVIATCEASVAFQGGLTSSINWGVSDTPSLSASQDIELRLPSVLGSGTYDTPVTVHGLFPVSAGARTFYFIGDQNGAGYTTTALDYTMTCVFIPTSYGTTQSSLEFAGPTDAGSPMLPPMTVDDLNAERALSIASNEARIERELEAMRARIAELEAANENAQASR